MPCGSKSNMKGHVRGLGEVIENLHGKTPLGSEKGVGGSSNAKSKSRAIQGQKYKFAKSKDMSRLNMGQ